MEAKVKRMKTDDVIDDSDEMNKSIGVDRNIGSEVNELHSLIRKPRANFEDFFTPGLQHLSENIFLRLDRKTLLSCRVVNSVWKDFFDKPRFWIKKYKKEGLKMSKKLLDILTNTIEIFEKNGCPEIMALSLMVEGPKSSMYPLNVATKYGNSELVQMLLDSGHTATKQDSDYNNPIHGAAKFGHLDIFKILLPHIEKPFDRNCFGQTPLHLAAQNGHVEVVKYLLSKVDHPNIEDYNKDTPFQLAMKNKHIETMHALVHTILYENYIKWHISSLGEIKFNCKYCNKEFSNLKYVQTHVKYFHSKGEELHQCEICGISFTTKYQGFLATHIEKVHKINDHLSCSICYLGVYRLDTGPKVLANHVREWHNSRDNPIWYYPCKLCGMIFNDSEDLQRHLQRKSDRNNDNIYHTCYICGDFYYNQWDLKQHINNIHEEQHYSFNIFQKEYECPWRLKYYNVIPKRTKKLMESCTGSRTKLGRNSQLSKTQKFYKIRKCDERFQTLQILKQHIQNNHLNQIYAGSHQASEYYFHFGKSF